MRDAFEGDSGPGRPQDTGAADLKGAHFGGANLTGSNFSDAKVDNNTRLEGANLSFSNFSDADLRSADLRGAN